MALITGSTGLPSHPASSPQSRPGPGLCGTPNLYHLNCLRPYRAIQEPPCETITFQVTTFQVTFPQAERPALPLASSAVWQLNHAELGFLTCKLGIRMVPTSFMAAEAKRPVASIACQALRQKLMILDVQPGSSPQRVSMCTTGWSQAGRQTVGSQAGASAGTSPSICDQGSALEVCTRNGESVSLRGGLLKVLLQQLLEDRHLSGV